MPIQENISKLACPKCGATKALRYLEPTVTGWDIVGLDKGALQLNPQGHAYIGNFGGTAQFDCTGCGHRWPVPVWAKTRWASPRFLLEPKTIPRDQNPLVDVKTKAKDAALQIAGRETRPARHGDLVHIDGVTSGRISSKGPNNANVPVASVEPRLKGELVRVDRDSSTLVDHGDACPDPENCDECSDDFEGSFERPSGLEIWINEVIAAPAYTIINHAPLVHLGIERRWWDLFDFGGSHKEAVDKELEKRKIVLPETLLEPEASDDSSPTNFFDHDAWAAAVLAGYRLVKVPDFVGSPHFRMIVLDKRCAHCRRTVLPLESSQSNVAMTCDACILVHGGRKVHYGRWVAFVGEEKISLYRNNLLEGIFTLEPNWQEHGVFQLGPRGLANDPEFKKLVRAVVEAS